MLDFNNVVYILKHGWLLFSLWNVASLTSNQHSNSIENWVSISATRNPFTNALQDKHEFTQNPSTVMQDLIKVLSHIC